MTTFNETYDTATPAGTDDPSEADDRMRETKAAVQERLAVDHKFSLTGTEVSAADSGEHTKITFNATIADPTQVAGKAHLYMKDDELVYQDDTNAALPITNGGGFAGGTVNGNRAITGKLDVDGNIDPTTYETTNGGFLDEDDMASDAADKVASQQSIKAYIDAQIAAIGSLFGTWVDGISITSGVASSAVSTDGILLIHVDTAAGFTRAQLFSGPNGTEAKGNFFTGSQIFDEQYVLPVKKGEKYKVTIPDGSPTITGYFIPIGS